MTNIIKDAQRRKLEADAALMQQEDRQAARQEDLRALAKRAGWVLAAVAAVGLVLLVGIIVFAPP